MDYLKIILTSVSSLAALFVLTKLGGNKQISELTMFDYIISITIGSIAAEMATELEEPLKPLFAMTIYALASLAISGVTAKVPALRRVLFGRSVFLMYEGRLSRDNLRRSHIDLSEFLMQCRSAGYFDLSAIHSAVLEPSGKISIFPFPNRRPVTADDLKLVPAGEEIFYNVIMDGVVLTKNLLAAGFTPEWLRKELKIRGINDEKTVLFASLGQSGTLHLFGSGEEKGKNDVFQ